MGLKNSEYFRRGLQYLVCGRFFEMPVLFSIRSFIYRWLFGMGPGASITRGVLLIRPHKERGGPLCNTPDGQLKIGKNVHINHDTEIDYSGGLEIGDDVTISQEVLIETHAHNARVRAKIWEAYPAPLTIGRGAWIGAKVIILPSVKRIGEGSIIGAGAIVTKDVDDWTIVVGNPAHKVNVRV